MIGPEQNYDPNCVCGAPWPCDCPLGQVMARDGGPVVKPTLIPFESIRGIDACTVREIEAAAMDDCLSLSEWEGDFVESVKDQLRRGGRLTPKQQTALSKIHRRI